MERQGGGDVTGGRLDAHGRGIDTLAARRSGAPGGTVLGSMPTYLLTASGTIPPGGSGTPLKWGPDPDHSLLANLALDPRFKQIKVGTVDGAPDYNIATNLAGNLWCLTQAFAAYRSGDVAADPKFGVTVNLDIAPARAFMVLPGGGDVNVIIPSTVLDGTVYGPLSDYRVPGDELYVVPDPLPAEDHVAIPVPPFTTQFGWNRSSAVDALYRTASNGNGFGRITPNGGMGVVAAGEGNWDSTGPEPDPVVVDVLVVLTVLLDEFDYLPPNFTGD